jgi:eukaryotic-like serine/threonine-protein kinase
VAIKVLPPELATASSAERFLREIRITAGLQHPHILPLLDSGFSGGLCWYAMPHVQGESLRDKLAGGQMSLKEAMRIAKEVALALGYAHAQGVVHRDIKPENIMLSGGMAIVMDFGLARALSGSSTVTAMGMPIGTPAYMSPEQVTGLGEVDARSDLYSLGCVIYEMVAGRPPFLATSAAVVMRMQMQEMPTPPSQVRPDVPAAVDPIIAKAMAKAPEARYQTAADLIEDIEMVGALATLGASMGASAAQAAPEAAKSGWKKLFGKFGS